MTCPRCNNSVEGEFTLCPCCGAVIRADAPSLQPGPPATRHPAHSSHVYPLRVLTGIFAVLLFIFAIVLVPYLSKSRQALKIVIRDGKCMVVAIPDRGIYRYSLSPTLSGPMEAERQQQRFMQALVKENVHFVSAMVTENEVKITTLPRDMEQVNRELMLINKAMTSVFGKGTFTAPAAADAWVPVTPQLQEVMCLRIKRRLDPEAVADVRALPTGPHQIMVEIPAKKTQRYYYGGNNNFDLQFRLLPSNITVKANNDSYEQTITCRGCPITDAQAIASSFLMMPGYALNPDATVTYDQQLKPAVTFSLIDKTKWKYIRAISDANSAAAKGGFCPRMAIVFANRIVDTVELHVTLYGKCIITGLKTREQAQDLANLLNTCAVDPDWVGMQVVNSFMVHNGKRLPSRYISPASCKSK